MNVLAKHITTALPNGGNKNMSAVTPETFIITAEHENGILHNVHTPQSESLTFILIPLVVILGVAIISGLAIYCIQRRRRLDNIRHTLIPMYTFSKADEDEWGVLLDNCSSNTYQENIQQK